MEKKFFSRASNLFPELNRLRENAVVIYSVGGGLVVEAGHQLLSGKKVEGVLIFAAGAVMMGLKKKEQITKETDQYKFPEPLDTQVRNYHEDLEAYKRGDW